MRIDTALPSLRLADDGRTGRTVRRVEHAYSGTDVRRVVGQLTSAVERLERAGEAAHADSHRPPFDGRAVGTPPSPSEEPETPFTPAPPAPRERERDAEDSPDRRQREGRGRQTDAAGRRQLSDDEQRDVQRLQEIDRQVRAHEHAHLAAGAGVTRGGATFSYATGPDGKRYATAGEVQVDTSPVPDNPAATLAKARQIESTALAPADPSPQDRQVAAAARRMAAEAQRDLLDQARRATGATSSASATNTPAAGILGTWPPAARPASQGPDASAPSAPAAGRLAGLVSDPRVLAYTRPVPTPVGSQFSVRA